MMIWLSIGSVILLLAIVPMAIMVQERNEAKRAWDAKQQAKEEVKDETERERQTALDRGRIDPAR